jgi:TonB family protein
MRALGGLTAFLLLSPVSGAQDPCSRLAVATLHPGSTVGEVRAVVVGEPVESQVLLADGKRASVQEYALPDGVLHVEYDGLLTRGEAHVVLVRQPLRQTYDAVTGLVSSLGDPVAGRDSLVQGLQAGPAVWIDPQCDAVLTYYRRPEYWLTGEVLTVLRIERLSGLSGDSPASPTVEGWRASVSPSAEVAAVPSTSGEMPPERTRYVEPTYPQRAKEMGVTGVVELRVLVQASGKVAVARVVAVEPAGYGFEQAAVEAAERWRFTPAPVGRWTDVKVEFP